MKKLRFDTSKLPGTDSVVTIFGDGDRTDSRTHAALGGHKPTAVIFKLDLKYSKAADVALDVLKKYKPLLDELYRDALKISCDSFQIPYDGNLRFTWKDYGSKTFAATISCNDIMSITGEASLEDIIKTLSELNQIYGYAKIKNIESVYSQIIDMVSLESPENIMRISCPYIIDVAHMRISRIRDIIMRKSAQKHTTSW